MSLTGHLTGPDCRLVSIVGLSGVGKTRLALQAAAVVASSFRDGVSFVPLAAVSSGEILHAALADALGLTAGHQRDARTRVLEHLRDKVALLVLDQCEQLRDAATLLPDLLARAPGVKVLVTSLERLNLRGEWTLPIRGLSLPSSEQPEDIATSDAVQLFIQDARRVRADCTPSPADLPFIRRICHLVDGIPLGIELAAAWTRVITCREIAHEIERSQNFLAEDRARSAGAASQPGRGGRSVLAAAFGGRARRAPAVVRISGRVHARSRGAGCRRVVDAACLADRQEPGAEYAFRPLPDQPRGGLVRHGETGH